MATRGEVLEIWTRDADVETALGINLEGFADRSCVGVRERKGSVMLI